MVWLVKQRDIFSRLQLLGNKCCRTLNCRSFTKIQGGSRS